LIAAENIAEFARIGCGMIESQLALASKETTDALNDLWVLGYCVGAFGAMGQCARLDQDTDGFRLVTVGLSYLMNGTDHGDERLRMALDNRDDPRFSNGLQAGGDEVSAWLFQEIEAPTALVKHFLPVAS
jgi:hypothetical protein